MFWLLPLLKGVLWLLELNYVLRYSTCIANPTEPCCAMSAATVLLFADTALLTSAADSFCMFEFYCSCGMRRRPEPSS